MKAYHAVVMLVLAAAMTSTVCALPAWLPTWVSFNKFSNLLYDAAGRCMRCGLTAQVTLTLSTNSKNYHRH